jgi:hypothetical protein
MAFVGLSSITRRATYEKLAYSKDKVGKDSSTENRAFLGNTMNLSKFLARAVLGLYDLFGKSITKDTSVQDRSMP